MPFMGFAAHVFPIYWVPQRVGRWSVNLNLAKTVGFQFIGFPSEWGVFVGLIQFDNLLVSNLLGSPASGEILHQVWTSHLHRVSNLLGSPASGEQTLSPMSSGSLPKVSNLLGSPASGEQNLVERTGSNQLAFPIYWVPQRVGRYPY